MRKHWLFAIASCVFICLPAGAEDRYADLNLSPQQTKAMGELDKSWKEQYQSLHSDLSEQRQKLLHLIADHKSDAGSILAGQARVTYLQNQLRALSTTYFLRKRNLLSEDQQRTFDGMVRERLATRKNIEM